MNEKERQKLIDKTYIKFCPCLHVDPGCDEIKWSADKPCELWAGHDGPHKVWYHFSTKSTLHVWE